MANNRFLDREGVKMLAIGSGCTLLRQRKNNGSLCAAGGAELPAG